MTYMSTTMLYVSTEGNDKWSGRYPEPNPDKTDGPVASLLGARNRIRKLREIGKLNWPVEVLIRGGRYEIRRPIVFDHNDDIPTIYRAFPGENPVFSGGRRIEGFEPSNVNGLACWKVVLPDVRDGRWFFRSLWVDGRRATRPQLPKPTADVRQRPFFRMKNVPGVTLQAGLFEPSNAFECFPGDVKNWKNLHDVEVVVLHYWTEARLPIESVDESTGLVRSTHYSRLTLKDDFNERWAKYYVDNVFEALTEPGQWYLDRPTGTLYYIPRPGESIESSHVIAPHVEQLLLLHGDPEAQRFVQSIRFCGLTFEHADWHLPDRPTLTIRHNPPLPSRKVGGSAQGAAHLPGAISLRAARNCALEDCTLRHIGFYAIDIGPACLGNKISGCDICDIGAGGVKINGADAQEPEHWQTGCNAITDNHLHDLGVIFHSGVGVLSMHAFGNRIAHNHIHDLFYSTISVGWVWGFAPSVSRDNVIEFNHLHDYGRNWLADMGGVYLLGVSPGTVVRNNLIHDALSPTYGGWGIYFDEGASHIVAENNVCYHFSSQPLHQHFGRENIVRNNILALGREAQVACSRYEGQNAFTLIGNIILSDGAPMYVGGYSAKLENRPFRADLNLFWDISRGQDVLFAAEKSDTTAKPINPKGLEQWRSFGNDHHSIIDNPGFADPGQGDFSYAESSPAHRIGFTPIDLSRVGPRPPLERD